MSRFKYTFIIPHKNSPELLQRCIDSIPERENVQIVIVDDNSSTEIVNRQKFPGLGRKHTEVYFTEDGKGAGYARNVGLAHAKGQWLLFADADDYYTSGFLDVLDKELEDDGEILYFNVFSNSEQSFGRTRELNEDYDTYASTKDLNLLKYKSWAPWNKVIASDFIRKHHIGFDEIPVGNDAMFSLKAASKAQKIKVIQDRLYCVTFEPQSITHKPMSYERRFAYTRINIRINRLLREIGLPAYQAIVTSPNGIFRIFQEKGWKTTLDYLKYIHREDSISGTLWFWFRKRILKNIG